jgi:hypothetical protein
VKVGDHKVFIVGRKIAAHMAKKEDRVYTTTAFRQNDVSRSVRSTIPEAIAVLLGIEDRTTVEWRVDGETRRVWVKAAKK